MILTCLIMSCPEVYHSSYPCLSVAKLKTGMATDEHGSTKTKKSFGLISAPVLIRVNPCSSVAHSLLLVRVVGYLRPLRKPGRAAQPPNTRVSVLDRLVLRT